MRGTRFAARFCVAGGRADSSAGVEPLICRRQSPVLWFFGGTDTAWPGMGMSNPLCPRSGDDCMDSEAVRAARPTWFVIVGGA